MKDIGIITPVVTPCSPQGEPDLEGLVAVCEDMRQAGCHGLFVAGSTGRGPWFDLAARVRVCETVAGRYGAQVPLFGGCLAPGLPAMLENARALAGAGAQIAVLTAPFYFSYSGPEVEAIFLRFADLCPLPVVIYDIPVFAGRKLETDVVLRLAAHGNIVGFKDSSTDLARFQELIRALEGEPDYFLLQGKENLLADSLLAGASGFVCSLLHVNPRPFAALYRAARAGQRELAQQLQERVNAVMALVEGCLGERPATSTLFHFLNYALRRRGVCENLVLDHEGDCPPAVAEAAQQAVDVLAEVAEDPSAAPAGGK